jgi:hypothetical protein
MALLKITGGVRISGLVRIMKDLFEGTWEMWFEGNWEDLTTENWEDIV